MTENTVAYSATEDRAVQMVVKKGEVKDVTIEQAIRILLGRLNADYRIEDAMIVIGQKKF